VEFTEKDRMSMEILQALILALILFGNWCFKSIQFSRMSTKEQHFPLHFTYSERYIRIASLAWGSTSGGEEKRLVVKYHKEFAIGDDEMCKFYKRDRRQSKVRHLVLHFLNCVLSGRTHLPI